MIILFINAQSPLHSGKGDDLFGATILSIVCFIGIVHGFRMAFNPTKYLEIRQRNIERIMFNTLLNPFSRKHTPARLEFGGSQNTNNPILTARWRGIILIIVCSIAEVALWHFKVFNAFFK